GNEEMTPSATPYDPSEGMAMLTQSPSGVPRCQARMWLLAAVAAEADEDAPRASMIAAPRLATVGMNSFSSQAWSLTNSAAFLPATSACSRSGYWVAEWLPQMVIRRISLTGRPVLAASWLIARLWSS